MLKIHMEHTEMCFLVMVSPFMTSILPRSGVSVIKIRVVAGASVRWLIMMIICQAFTNDYEHNEDYQMARTQTKFSTFCFCF